MPSESPMQHLEQLIADDQLEAALVDLTAQVAETDAALRDELMVHRARLAQAEKGLRRGLIDTQSAEQTRNRVRYAVLELAREWGRRHAPAAGSDRPPAPGPDRAVSKPNVFISYSRTDAEVVDKIRQALESAGIRVRIDDQDIRPGEDIESFIRRAVGQADVVLSIVSAQSLLSPWVGMESVHTLYDEALKGGHKLIAGYLDPHFLDLGFRLTATDQIDARIAQIEALAAVYAERHLDTNDLARQKTRLFELRNNLGKILDRLRNALCLDLRESQLDSSLRRLIAAIVQGRD
jgi:hypothetical protein